MKRLSIVGGLLYPAAWLAFASLMMHAPVYGQIGFGAAGGMGGVESSMSEADVNLQANAKAKSFIARSLLLSARFYHNGVEIESNTGVGFVLATPRGQRILVMPSSLTKPVQVSLGKDVEGKSKLWVNSSWLLVAKSDGQLDSNTVEFFENVPDSVTNQIESNDDRSKAEARIYQALSNRGEVSFIQRPLWVVLDHLRNEHNIPILTDERALKTEGITADELITLELPEVSFESTLNLILEPLGLAFVIQNEVMMITSKAGAEKLAVGRINAITEVGTKGVLLHSQNAMGNSGGMGMGSRGTIALTSRVRRFRTLQEAQNNSPKDKSRESKILNYAAIAGPLAKLVSKNLDVSFISIPGNFEAISIPTHVDLGTSKFVRVNNSWVECFSDDARIQSALEGAPVVNEQGEPIGMFIGQKVVPFPELLEAFESIKSENLGYWGDEIVNISPPVGESKIGDDLPELISAEMKSRLKDVASSLQGFQKTEAMFKLRAELEIQVMRRTKLAEEKMNSLREKLDILGTLTNDMRRRDVAAVNRLLPAELALQLPITEVENNDPFK